MEFASIGTETEAGWNEWMGSNVETSETGVRLATVPTFLPPAVVADLPGVAVVDADVGECDDLYVLGRRSDAESTGAGGVLYRIDRGSGTPRRLPCLDFGDADVERGETSDASEMDGTDDDGDDPGWAPTALCLTADTVYVAEWAGADDRQQGRVRALSAHLFQTRWISAGSLVAPVALVESEGVVYALDAGDDPAVAVVHPDGRVERVISGFDAPTDMSADDTGSLYVLDETDGTDGDEDGGPLVRRFETDALDPTVDPLTASDGDAAALPDGTTCIEVVTDPTGDPERLAGTRTAVFACAGPDAFGETSLVRYAFTEDAFGAGGSETVLRFESRCARLLWRSGTDPHRGLYGVDREAGTVYFLAATRRNRVTSGRLAHDARLVRRFDSGIPGVQWHRLTLDRDVGEAGTQVRVSYYATDDPDEDLELLEAVPGIGERYATRLRAAGVAGISDLADLSPPEVAEVVSTQPGTASLARSNAEAWLDEARDWTARWRPLHVPDPTDALVTDAVGRYLWVKLELLGSETASPHVASVRAYFPRQSYLRYLPTVYSEDERSAAFLDRFLSLFESVFVDVEAGIERVTTYLDPHGIPPEHVAWLGEWLALDVDETWSEAAGRDLVASAPALFEKRGTPDGMLETLRIYLRDVSVVPPTWERARERERETLDALVEAGLLTTSEMNTALADHAALATERRDDRLLWLLEATALDRIDDTEVAADYRRLVGSPHGFVVLVRSAVDDERMRTVERIVESGTPAHATGRAVRLRPRVELGGHTYLNVNSVLSDPEFVVGEGALGTDTSLTERDPYAQLGVRARVGEDTLIS